MIHKFLNIRNSLRDLTDEEFDVLLPQLAKELEGVSFYTEYSDIELLTDWQKLLGWNANVNTMASTQRIGMKLCEHFFPNFYDIEDKKGNSFKSLWTAKNLEKVLRWNRKSHSTPYLSEIKRGIYFNFGLPKSTMYRPQMAKMVVSNLGGVNVFDPCAGWGGRMLGSIAAGADMYTAFEPNTETYNNLLRLIEFLGIKDKVRLYKDSALNMYKYDIKEVDIVLTSPPYFDLEVYTHEDTQSITGCTSYQMWVDKFLEPLVTGALSTLKPTGWSCWNVHNVGKMKMIDDVAKIHKKFPTKKIFSVISSRRQINQKVPTKNEKNSDVTICYSNNSITDVEKFF
jgi:16S rRNA G966 N2-methylase RsmD